MQVVFIKCSFFCFNRFFAFPDAVQLVRDQEQKQPRILELPAVHASIPYYSI